MKNKIKHWRRPSGLHNSGVLRSADGKNFRDVGVIRATVRRCAKWLMRHAKLAAVVGVAVASTASAETGILTNHVNKIIAGTNVTISPTRGTGDVTINASGGGSSYDETQSTMAIYAALQSTGSALTVETARAIAAEATKQGVLGAGSIDTAKLAADSVIGSKILNATIDTAKLNATIQSQLAASGTVPNGYVDTNKLATDAIIGSKILNGTIDTTKLNATIQAQLAMAGTSTGGESNTFGTDGSSKTFGGIVYGKSTAAFTIANTTYAVGGVIAHADYTVVTTTCMGANGIAQQKGYVYVYFATVTVNANTLKRRGDTLEIWCEGTFTKNTGSITRGLMITLNSVAISSRTASMGNPPEWRLGTTLQRTSVGNQILSCIPGTVACNITYSLPTTFFDNNAPMTFDETQDWKIACAASISNVSGNYDTSFLRLYVKYIPGP